MSHTPNELHNEFEGQEDKIHQLKLNNAHFAKLADKHHELARDIHRMETDIEPVSDETLNDLKKQRLTLLDEIKALLDAA